MSDFDRTTERKGEEAAKKYAREMGGFPKGFTVAGVNGHTRGWDEGRNSVKESLEILARAVEHYCGDLLGFDHDVANDAKAAVVKAGNWPLPSGEKGKGEEE